MPPMRRALVEGATFAAAYVGLDLAERLLLVHWATGLPWYLPAGLALAFVIVRGLPAIPWLVAARLALYAADWTYPQVVHGAVSALAAAAITLLLAVPFRRLPRASDDG